MSHSIYGSTDAQASSSAAGSPMTGAEAAACEVTSSGSGEPASAYNVAWCTALAHPGSQDTSSTYQLAAIDQCGRQAQKRDQAAVSGNHRVLCAGCLKFRARHSLMPQLERQACCMTVRKASCFCEGAENQ